MENFIINGHHLLGQCSTQCVVVVASVTIPVVTAVSSIGVGICVTRSRANYAGARLSHSVTLRHTVTRHTVT